MRKNTYITILIVILLSSCTQNKDVTIKIYHTTDMHGNFFPYDLLRNRDTKGSLSRVSTFMRNERSQNKDNILFLDGGDVLQGQPTVYYYNFIDTVSRHICASIMNYLEYDAAVPGNHDIEPGHAVYDRWIAECNFPVLAANIISVKSGELYLPPYKVFTKAGVKIAVLGMITQAIPAWLPENLWSGLCFEEIQPTAAKWVPYILEHEKPDVMIALIHSGLSGGNLTDYHENEALFLAQTVPGLDVVFYGHDHSPCSEKIVNTQNDSVLVINPGAWGYSMSDVSIQVKKEGGKVTSKTVSGKLTDITDIDPDPEFLKKFNNAYETVSTYVNEEIGEFTRPIDARESFFGPSAFIDLLHQLQLKITNADLSLLAPLSQTAYIDSGKVYMRDMFNLYRFENLLYTMELTGKEVLGILEYCYGLSINQMKSPDDHLLRIKQNPSTGAYYFISPSFSFDSAAGLYYTVDVTKPAGQRVNIISKADGTPFELDKTYKVAINSYQGSGGGGLLTEGAGIPKVDLPGRTIFSTDKDMRYYLVQMIKEMKVVTPEALNQWKYIPEDWAKKAGERDYKLLFE